MSEKIKYTISKDQKLYYSSVLILENMINFGDKFPVLLEGDDKMLEDLLIYMAAKNWVSVEGTNYVGTAKGREVLVNYKERLVEFRSLYKVFSAVDTGEGEFGYSSYYDFETDTQFEAFIDEERFEDLRVAVCEMKKINPLDVIFMEMVDCGAFDSEEDGWQAELVTGLIWADIEDIANSNLHLVDLTEYNEDGSVEFSGEEVIEEILKQGTELCKELITKQAEIDAEEEEEEEIEEEEEVIIEETTIEYVEDPYYEDDYWDCYYDPYYVSPCWGVYYY